jgi:S1-C subfamily serine protease
MNKVVIWLIVVLFVISIGAGAFAIVLNGKIGTLDSETQAFKADTASQFSTVKSNISSVDSSLTTFKTDTTNKFTGVQNSVTSLNSDLSAFKSDTTTKLNSAQSSINSLNSNVTNIGTQLDESTLNARRVYDDVIGGVCEVTGDIGSGSGFIYSADGYIVTCWHVIDGQSYLDVILHDGTCRRATVVGSDKYSDVAVIKIRGVSNLKPLPLADSDALVAGEPVIVVGNPFEIFETMTYGVISRTRGMTEVSGFDWWVSNLILFDAAANPGNSGGPLFNNEGQVIGIAAYISSGEGVNMAISSNKVKRVANAIIDHGSFTNATLPGSWTISDLTPETAIERGLDSSFGAIFKSVSGMGSVEVNDIVSAIDGVAVTEWHDIFNYIAEYKSVGDTVKLTLIRGSGTRLEVSLTLVKGWVFSV